MPDELPQNDDLVIAAEDALDEMYREKRSENEPQENEQEEKGQ